MSQIFAKKSKLKEEKSQAFLAATMNNAEQANKHATLYCAFNQAELPYIKQQVGGLHIKLIFEGVKSGAEYVYA